MMSRASRGANCKRFARVKSSKSADAEAELTITMTMTMYQTVCQNC